MSNGRRQPSCGGTSRMTRECQVRFCERLGVQFPGPTRHVWTAPDWQELFYVDAALVGCGHVSGLLLRHGWPLALMLCADQVPILRTHSKMR